MCAFVLLACRGTEGAMQTLSEVFMPELSLLSTRELCCSGCLPDCRAPCTFFSTCKSRPPQVPPDAPHCLPNFSSPTFPSRFAVVTEMLPNARLPCGPAGGPSRGRPSRGRPWPWTKDITGTITASCQTAVAHPPCQSASNPELPAGNARGWCVPVSPGLA